jgi:hypothetical protein
VDYEKKKNHGNKGIRKDEWYKVRLGRKKK